MECVRVAVYAILRDFVSVTATSGHFWAISGPFGATLGHFGPFWSHFKVFEVFDEVSTRLAWFGMD